MRNIRLLIEYDGTDYAGWQIQRNKNTVQAEIVRAIKKVSGEDVILYGASRTDAGVHARGQVANFMTHSKISAAKFTPAINFYLPQDIGVRKSEEVPDEFHSQYKAKSKIYVYTIYNSYIHSPMNRLYSYHLRGKLSIEKMREAAKLFEGEHDFRAYGTESGKRKTTVRTIYKIAIQRDDEIIRIIMEGNGFLHNMVRCICGSLTACAMGKKSLDDLKQAINHGSRVKAGPILPPEGLLLQEVRY